MSNARDTMRFRRLLAFRRLSVPTQILRVLEDEQGWYYVASLAGTPDFGPYLLAEITSAFEVESEPCAKIELESSPPASGHTS